MAIEAWLAEMSEASEAQFARWSKPRQMAFPINACNGFPVGLILTRYPDLLADSPAGRPFVAEGRACIEHLDCGRSLNGAR